MLDVLRGDVHLESWYVCLNREGGIAILKTACRMSDQGRSRIACRNFSDRKVMASEK